jgi:hypothetical protein
MSTEELLPFLWANWARLREELLAGTYQPSPVKQSSVANRVSSHQPS